MYAKGKQGLVDVVRNLILFQVHQSFDRFYQKCDIRCVFMIYAFKR